MAGIDYGNPGWIAALSVAGGAFLGVWRFATKRLALRREKADEYERLWCDTYGWPAEYDAYGNEISPARPGIIARLERLEHPEPRTGTAP